MSYKFIILSYVISTVALVANTDKNPTPQTRTADNDNANDKIVNVTDSARGAKTDTVPVADFSPFQAEQQGKSVVYVYRDGSRVVRHDGTRAWRNNNPGNLRYYDFAKRNGAIGEAGNFAVFPNEETGLQALYNLLKTESYQKLTIIKALKRYAPSTWQAYTRKLTRLTGLSANTKLCELTQEQLNLVVKTIRQLEGWIPGREHKINAPQYAMLYATRQRGG